MSGGRRRDGASGDDTFAGALRGVKPLAGRGKMRAPPEPPATAPRSASPPEPRFDIEREGDDVFARAHDVSRRQLADLRAGRVAVERETDLHGLAPNDARKALHHALERALRDGIRCLLVIHGAGHHSASSEPVLKRELPEWLARAPVAADILAFATAPARHGGPGASLVLLRRLRPRER